MKTSQILHVFRKDVRRHWMEILLCQAALVIYCWSVVRSWNVRGIAVLTDFLSTFIVLLLPLTWGFLVFRVVQGESLVGDRQFWVTRPYEWKKLLAEKVFFVLVFINVPTLVAGVLLLIRAGFSPAPYTLGLLWMQLLLIQLPFLPFLALASVTRNLAQGLLALLAVLLYIAGNVALDTLLETAGLSSGHVDWLAGMVLVIVCLAALGLQYSRRKTGQSRAWLGGGALAMVVIWLAGAFAARGKDPYPLPAAGQPTYFHAGLDPVKLSPPKNPAETDEDIAIGIPVRAWGLPANSLGRIRGVKLTLEAPDGVRWESGWQGYYGLFGPGENHWRQDFVMKHAVYERLKALPLKARVSVAMEILREHDFESATPTAREFDVPRVGRCRVWNPKALQCRSPLLRPSLVVLRVDPDISSCPPLEYGNQLTLPDTMLEGIPYAWESRSASDSGPAEYGINPVQSFSFYFRSVGICPGTPLRFSLPQSMAGARSDFEIGQLNLEEYRRPGIFSGQGAIGISVYSR